MDFETREDRSAVQYALRANPAFWVRVAKPMVPRLEITSAMQGDLTDCQFGEALSEILGRHCSGDVSSIRFRDIAASLTADMSDKQAVGRRFDFFSAMLRRWAQAAGREEHDGQLDIRGGTFAAIFRLA
jgi:hypothetical protein